MDKNLRPRPHRQNYKQLHELGTTDLLTMDLGKGEEHASNTEEEQLTSATEVSDKTEDNVDAASGDKTSGDKTSSDEESLEAEIEALKKQKKHKLRGERDRLKAELERVEAQITLRKRQGDHVTPTRSRSSPPAAKPTKKAPKRLADAEDVSLQDLRRSDSLQRRVDKRLNELDRPGLRRDCRPTRSQSSEDDKSPRKSSHRSASPRARSTSRRRSVRSRWASNSSSGSRERTPDRSRGKNNKKSGLTIELTWIRYHSHRFGCTQHCHLK